jgi:DNA-binding NarL/FixJ family response regulator
MTNRSPFRVVLVDDHPIIRDGYQNLLEADEDFSVVGEADAGEEMLEKISDVDADLAIIDISLGGMDGIELTHRLAEKAPSLRVLIASMHGKGRYVEDALEAGASGYVLKDNVHNTLLEAARTVMEDDQYMDNDLKGPIGVA